MHQNLYFTDKNTSHNTFGGLISLSDFDTNYKRKTNSGGSLIARHIIADWSFDEQCRKNIANQIGYKCTAKQI